MPVIMMVVLMWFVPLMAFPTVADPPVISNSIPLCQSSLFDVSFKSYAAIPFTFARPTCLTAGLRVVLSLSCNVTEGRQFDRSIYVEVEGALVLAGTTPEPRATLSPAWTVASDLTEFTSLFSSNALFGSVNLGTVFNEEYNGLPSCAATLLVFNIISQQKVPDLVLPLGSTRSSSLQATFSLPGAVSEAHLLVTSQGQNVDEFW
jgi:hypothetical protein